MAVSSLTRMTVPLASDQSSSTQGLLMPKLKYRFRVVFEGLGISTPRTELTKQVISFARPEVSFEEIMVPIYNSTLKLAGKHSWGDIAVEMRDDAGGNVSKLVGEQIQKQFDFLEQSSARTGGDYKFQMLYEVLDGGNGNTSPTVLEAWELDGCFLTSVDYGEMSYGSPDPAQIACNIRFDNATQRAGEGVGTTVVTKTPSDSALGS
jgi:hypothetical protein